MVDVSCRDYFLICCCWTLQCVLQESIKLLCCSTRTIPVTCNLVNPPARPDILYFKNTSRSKRLSVSVHRARVIRYVGMGKEDRVSREVAGGDVK